LNAKVQLQLERSETFKNKEKSFASIAFKIMQETFRFLKKQFLFVKLTTVGNSDG
jgi:hypothetical protein